jgi:hypothetical protein
VVNTSLNTAGRPMVDDPRDALECFGSRPVDALAIGPFLVRRAADGETAPAGSRRERRDVVVPSGGRASSALLERWRATRGARAIVVVDDRGTPRRARARRSGELVRGAARPRGGATRVARRSARWVAFLDDDVCRRPVGAGARRRPRGAGRVGGSQGRIRVPLPADRADGLGAQRRRARGRAWATADMAYRRAALEAVGGLRRAAFSARLCARSYADIGRRLTACRPGASSTRARGAPPGRPRRRGVSLRKQAGNADDVRHALGARPQTATSAPACRRPEAAPLDHRDGGAVAAWGGDVTLSAGGRRRAARLPVKLARSGDRNRRPGAADPATHAAARLPVHALRRRAAVLQHRHTASARRRRMRNKRGENGQPIHKRTRRRDIPSGSFPAAASCSSPFCSVPF